MEMEAQMDDGEYQQTGHDSIELDEETQSKKSFLEVLEIWEASDDEFEHLHLVEGLHDNY